MNIFAHEQINTLPLFPALNEKLVSFLRQLTAADWQRQTIARLWTVKDVVAHLVDVNFRYISIQRDGWLPVPDREINKFESLVGFLNSFNGQWVDAAKRLSPALLTELIESSSKEVLDIMRKLPSEKQSVFSVAWAGQDVSPNWFDIAREYTERFLHQQQIRAACGNNDLLNDEFYKPFLEIFMYAWPHTMCDTLAVTGTVLKATVTGPGGGSWWLVKIDSGWVLESEPPSAPVAETTIDGAVAWIIFSKSRRAAHYPDSFSISGDKQLGSKWLDMVSVMA